VSRDFLCHIEKPGEIRSDDPIKVRRSVLSKGFRYEDTSVVDEDVDLAKPLLGASD
jgi:hypothetical protein